MTAAFFMVEFLRESGVIIVCVFTHLEDVVFICKWFYYHVEEGHGGFGFKWRKLI